MGSCVAQGGFNQQEPPHQHQQGTGHTLQTFSLCQCSPLCVWLSLTHRRAGSDAGQAQRISGWDLPPPVSTPEKEKGVSAGLPAFS